MTIATASERWHALDAARGLALLLGVLLHGTLSYLPGAGYWYPIAEQDSSTALAGLFYLIHAFRMLLFFLLAGFFGRLALQRRGTRDFIGDRARRIGLVLLSFWFPLFAAIVAVAVWATWFKLGGQLPAESPPGPAFTPDDFPLLHLWFLWLLLLAYAAMLIWRALLQRLDPAGRLAGLADRWLPRLLSGSGMLLLALPLALVLPLTTDWSPWFGIPTPDQSLYPNPAALVGYGSAFALGWLLQRQADRLWAQIRRRRWQYLLIALPAGAVCLGMLGMAPAYQPEQTAAELRAYAMAYALLGWSLALAVLGFALQHWSDESPARRYLADAAYWIYLVHLPLLMGLQLAASRYAAPVWVEYPLLVGLAMALLLLSYRWWVRNGRIGALLNGRRREALPTAALSAGAPRSSQQPT